MIVTKITLEALCEFINDGPIYRTGKKLVEFFNILGFTDIEMNVTSRKRYTEEKLNLINGTPKLDKCIKMAFEPQKFIDEYQLLDDSITSFNKHLAFDDYEIIKEGRKITLIKAEDEEIVEKTEYISALPSTRTITFSPEVFQIPQVKQDDNLVSVMMPFNTNFDNLYKCIKEACLSVGFNCLRADDIWENSAIIQDVFELIFKSKIVIVDFSTRNPNVMYETGIAHSLGKTVIPITQNIDDIPSDMQHHRALPYLNNSQGLQEMSVELKRRLKNLRNK